MRLNDVVNADWLQLKDFSGIVYRCVDIINSVYGNSALELKVIPSNLQTLLYPFKLISPYEVKAVLLGIEPPYGTPPNPSWYYNGIPFDTPRHLQPIKVTRRMMDKFNLGIPPTTAYGYLEQLYAQGLLIMNASLSATQGYARTHLKVWLPYFTLNVLRELAIIRPGIVVAVASSHVFSAIGKQLSGAKVIRVTSPYPSTSEMFYRDRAYDLLLESIHG